MTVTVTIYSDLHCPWPYVCTHRLRTARDEHGLDVVLDQRAWPLEWLNGRGTPRQIVEPEAAVLANHEEELFSRFRGESWPSTFLPAFELVAAARRAFGLRAAEEVDYQLRRRFFRKSADVSQRHELAAAASDAGLDADTVLKVWATEPVRRDVVADFEASASLPIQGSGSGVLAGRHDHAQPRHVRPGVGAGPAAAAQHRPDRAGPSAAGPREVSDRNPPDQPDVGQAMGSSRPPGRHGAPRCAPAC